MELDNIIRYELNEAISEEMGIADTVKKEGERFSEKIKNLIKTQDAKKETVTDNVIKNSYDFYDDIMNENFNVSVVYYNFLTRESFEINSQNIDYNSAQLISDGKKVRFLIIKCYGISGGLDISSLYDSVYHELSHYYQGIYGNKEIFDDDPKYMTASSYLRSSVKMERDISLLYYYSKRFEGDGYVNGLYGSLTALNNPIPKYDDIKNTDAYMAIKQFRFCLTEVSENSENKEYQNFCQKKYGVSLSKLLKMAYTSYYRFMRNIGRVLMKIRKDKINEGIHFGISTNRKTCPLII